jgi:hypothetical protein
VPAGSSPTAVPVTDTSIENTARLNDDPQADRFLGG